MDPDIERILVELEKIKQIVKKDTSQTRWRKF